MDLDAIERPAEVDAGDDPEAGGSIALDEAALADRPVPDAQSGGKPHNIQTHTIPNPHAA